MTEDVMVRIAFKGCHYGQSVDTAAKNVILVNAKQTNFNTTGSLVDIVRKVNGQTMVVPWDSVLYIKQI